MSKTFLKDVAGVADAGTKFDEDKSAVQYLPPLAMLEVGKAYAAGAKKYGPWNYRNGLNAMRCIGGALRHTFQWVAGEDYDKETGAHHLASAIANLLMALENVLLYPERDDRHKPKI